MKEIIVHTQEELDAIPKDCTDKIIIKSEDEIVVSNRYGFSVTVCDTSTVRAYGTSTVVACDTSTVTACDTSTVRAYGTSTVTACGTSTVRAYGTSTVRACDTSTVTACDTSTVRAYGTSTVRAYGTSTVRACDTSTVTACDTSTVRAYGTSTVRAYGTSTVTACDTSTVRAYGTSTVTACDTSTVTAYGNSQILKESENCQIQTSGNARIVYLPKTADEFLDYYGIKHADGKAILYKAVHKAEKGYCSNYNKDFTYNINETITEKCDRDVNKDCASGIHVAYLDWALQFGENFDNLAILEVTTDVDKIIMPKNTNGKVRTSEIYVVREVPLEECGVLGSIIARRMK